MAFSLALYMSVWVLSIVDTVDLILVSLEGPSDCSVWGRMRKQVLQVSPQFQYSRS